MIKNKEPISINGISQYIKKSDDSEITPFIKKFSKLKLKQADELKEKLEKLEFLKMRKEHLIKIIDLIPEDSGDLNKIFVDVGLNEDETQKILETVKEFR